MDGLCIMRPLDEDVTKCAMPEEMKRMLDAFRSTISLQDIPDDEYESMLNDTAHFTFTATSPQQRRGTAPVIITP